MRVREFEYHLRLSVNYESGTLEMKIFLTFWEVWNVVENRHQEPEDRRTYNCPACCVESNASERQSICVVPSCRWVQLWKDSKC